MKILILATVPLLIAACGDGGPTNPGPTTTSAATTSVPVSQIEITTLITVYRSAASPAQFTQATTSEMSIGQVLLGTDDVTPGTTVLDNELLRHDLQAAIDRVNEQFSDADFEAAFGETKENLRRFLNDADNDGWSIDGRHGEGRDWPHDSDGNDPDGFTTQIVVTVSRS